MKREREGVISAFSQLSQPDPEHADSLRWRPSSSHTRLQESCSLCLTTSWTDHVLVTDVVALLE